MARSFREKSSCGSCGAIEPAVAAELICTQPNIGAVATNVKLPGVRRILLSKVRYYLYYRVKSKPSAVEVVAIWHTSRYPERKRDYCRAPAAAVISLSLDVALGEISRLDCSLGELYE